jgi:maltose-binding protein MalE
MKKYIYLLASLAMLAACEQKETTVTNPPAEKKESNTTVVNPPEQKKESNTTVINPATETKQEKTEVNVNTSPSP